MRKNNIIIIFIASIIFSCFFRRKEPYLTIDFRDNKFYISDTNYKLSKIYFEIMRDNHTVEKITNDSKKNSTDGSFINNSIDIEHVKQMIESNYLLYTTFIFKDNDGTIVIFSDLITKDSLVNKRLLKISMRKE